MLNKIARRISTKLLLQKIISKDMFEIYVYGFELLISFLFSVLLIVLIGAIAKQFIPSIFFLLSFVLLRSFTGGYHANTYLTCLIVTIITYTSVIFLAEMFDVHFFLYLILIIIGVPLLVAFSPVEHQNKPITDKHRYRCKIISVLSFFMFAIIGAVSSVFETTSADALFFTLIADLLLMFIKNPKAGGKKYENNSNSDF